MQHRFAFSILVAVGLHAAALVALQQFWVHTPAAPSPPREYALELIPAPALSESPAPPSTPPAVAPPLQASAEPRAKLRKEPKPKAVRKTAPRPLPPAEPAAATAIAPALMATAPVIETASTTTPELPRADLGAREPAVALAVSGANPPLSATPAEAGNLRSAPVAAQPAYRTNPAPEYPAAAKRKGQAGVVLLGVEVSASGTATVVEIEISSGHNLLDDAAVKAVRRWKFEPARLDGTPIASHVQVPVRFRLDG